MEHWDLTGLDVEPHRPNVLHSKRGEARSIALRLPAGEELQEHEVHERGRLVVIEGEVEVRSGDGEPLAAAAGHLFEFDPGERRTITARSDAVLLLVLSPWPGDGHPGALSLAEKAEVRERAAEHRDD